MAFMNFNPSEFTTFTERGTTGETLKDFCSHNMGDLETKDTSSTNPFLATENAPYMFSSQLSQKK
jgi:hypothetical protein